MLDAARGLVLGGGSGSATIEAIAEASGAPVGTIYHRFGSRDELVTRLWMRAVYRSQASFLAAIEGNEPRAGAVAAGLSILGFCSREPEDGRLLVSYSREDLIRAAPAPEIERELKELNAPVERAVRDLTRAIHGRVTKAATQHVMLIVFDLPYGAVRRHLAAGRKPPRGLEADLRVALEAVADRA